MKNKLSSWCLFWASLWIALALSAQAEPPEQEAQTRLRAAAVKGLEFLAREGDTWMNEKTCNACHHLPLLLWSHREARQRGIPVAPAQFKEYEDWADERAKDTRAGPEVLAFLKLAMPAKPSPELTKLILERQQADGSWKPGGQFASMQRRALDEATENSARVFLLALATQETDSGQVETARKKATALLEKSGSAKSVETLVFRLFFAQRFGPATEAAALRAQILAAQHADGGWAWMLAEERSDSLATGEVLYVLQHFPDPSSAKAVEAGRRWLLEQQRADGGWAIDITRISKIDRSAPDKAKSLQQATEIYTFWGSAWATLGLLEGLPTQSD